MRLRQRGSAWPIHRLFPGAGGHRDRRSLRNSRRGSVKTDAAPFKRGRGRRSQVPSPLPQGRCEEQRHERERWHIVSASASDEATRRGTSIRSDELDPPVARAADQDRRDFQAATLDRGRRREASRLRIGSPGDRGMCPLTVSTALLEPSTLCALVLTYLGLNLACSQWSTACATRNDAAGSRRGPATKRKA